MRHAGAISASLISALLLVSASVRAETLPDHVEHAAYLVRAAGVPARTGQPASVELSIETRAGYHLNDDYPIHFVPAVDPSVTFDKPRYDASDGLKRVSCGAAGHDCRAMLPVRYTGKQAGPAQVGGTLSFSVCNEAECRIEKRAVAAAVQIKP